MLSPAAEYLYGDEASVQCYRGFRLTGSAVITCGPDQQFINLPRCQGQSESAGRGARRLEFFLPQWYGKQTEA